MAVLAIVYVKGCKTQDYDNLRKEIHWDQNQPKGLIIHIAGVDDAGDMRVADIWESADDFKTFGETKLMPAFKKFKLPDPTMNVYPIHNVNVFEQIEKFGMAGSMR
jgi:hypothetical protein